MCGSAWNDDLCNPLDPDMCGLGASHTAESLKAISGLSEGKQNDAQIHNLCCSCQ